MLPPPRPAPVRLRPLLQVTLTRQSAYPAGRFTVRHSTQQSLLLPPRLLVWARSGPSEGAPSDAPPAPRLPGLDRTGSLSLTAGSAAIEKMRNLGPPVRRRYSNRRAPRGRSGRSEIQLCPARACIGGSRCGSSFPRVKRVPRRRRADAGANKGVSLAAASPTAASRPGPGFADLAYLRADSPDLAPVQRPRSILLTGTRHLS